MGKDCTYAKLFCVLLFNLSAQSQIASPHISRETTSEAGREHQLHWASILRLERADHRVGSSWKWPGNLGRETGVDSASAISKSSPATGSPFEMLQCNYLGFKESRKHLPNFRKCGIQSGPLLNQGHLRIPVVLHGALDSEQRQSLLSLCSRPVTLLSPSSPESHSWHACNFSSFLRKTNKFLDFQYEDSQLYL